MSRRFLDHPAEQPLYVERILTDENAFHILHDLSHTAAIRFADAGHARVCVDTHEVPLEVAFDHARLDIGDLDSTFFAPVRRVVRVISHWFIWCSDRSVWLSDAVIDSL
jgi:hypothetical protein